VDDAVIARCQEWISEHYREPSPVAAMVRLGGIAERSFKRRFQAATGMSPLEYGHTLRLEAAKEMLETSDRPAEAIAFEVGYEDAVRRAARRHDGLTRDSVEKVHCKRPHIPHMYTWPVARAPRATYPQHPPHTTVSPPEQK
jgi:transcriptional regulator GlxA family with amidase domain